MTATNPVVPRHGGPKTPASKAILLLLILAASSCSERPTKELPDLPRLSLESMAPEVRQQIKTANEESLQNPNNAEAVGRLGMLLQAYEQLKAAEVCYLRATLLSPDDFRWLYYLGTVRFLRGKDPEAIATLKQALKLDPHYLPAQLKLAETLRSAGEFEEARRRYNEIIETHPASALAFFGLGKLEEEAHQDVAAAITHYEKACEIAPNFAAAHYALAQAYRKLGEDEQAHNHLSLYQEYQSSEQPLVDQLLYTVSELKAKTASISGSQDHFERGLSLADSGNLAAAVKEFERALEIHPHLIEARTNLIPLYASIGQIAKAREQYRTAVEMDPQRPGLHFNFGVLMAERREYEEAEKAFRKTLEIDSEHAFAHNNLAQMLEAQGELNEAEQHYRFAVQSKPDYRLAHFHLGRVLLGRGKVNEGLRHFLRTLTPEDEETPRYMLDVAVAFARVGRSQEAERYAQQAKEKAMRLEQNEVAQMADKILAKLERSLP